MSCEYALLTLGSRPTDNEGCTLDEGDWSRLEVSCPLSVTLERKKVGYQTKSHRAIVTE